MNTSKHIGFVALVVMMSMVTAGCAHTGHITVRVNTGVFEAEAHIAWEKEDEVEGLPGIANFFGQPMSLSQVADEFYFELSSSGANIPDQSTSVTLMVSDSFGVLGAQTFPAAVSGGRLEPVNANDVVQWASQFDNLESGKLSISAPTVQLVEPPAGHYTVSGQLRHGDRIVAQATASGYSSGGGGCSDCVMK